MTCFKAMALIFVCGSTVTANATPPPKVIAGFYAKVDALSLKKDGLGVVKLFDANCAADYVAYDLRGQKRTRDEKDQQILATLSVIQSYTKAITHIDKTIVTPRGVMMVISGTHSQLMLGNGKDKKTKGFTITEKREDTWHKIGGYWKLKLSRILGETINDKAK